MPLPPNVKQRIAGILAEKSKNAGQMPLPMNSANNPLHPTLDASPVTNSLAITKPVPAAPPILQQGSNILNQGKFFNIKKKLTPGRV